MAQACRSPASSITVPRSSGRLAAGSRSTSAMDGTHRGSSSSCRAKPACTNSLSGLLGLRPWAQQGGSRKACSSRPYLTPGAISSPAMCACVWMWDAVCSGTGCGCVFRC